MPDNNKRPFAEYLQKAAQQIMGPQPKPPEEPPEQRVKKPVGNEEIAKAISTLGEYKSGKSNLESRIVEEERWWKLRHWDLVNSHKGGRTGEEARPEPTSAWLFNSLTNKHADIMDNFPEPNVLPREQEDEQDAEILSEVLPVIFERNHYEDTYSHAAWYKLKHGVVAKGVFWNTALDNGLGDVDVRFVDLLNVFWEPGITDIQDSRNLFIVDLRDNDLLEQEYPELAGKLSGNVVDVQQYVYDDTVDVSSKSVVVDWYYKKRTPEGRTILHLVKFVGSTLLFASENEPETYPNGYYDHGQYPISLDVLFPEEGTPIGFGYISVMKSPQLYIDKLNQVILENAMMAAKPRFMARKNSAINEDEFLDWSKPIVWYEGGAAGDIVPLQVQQVGSNVINVLQMKIDELKETSSNRDVSQGSSSGGVTAAAAIAALQEAGNKTSRDMIATGYRAFTRECYLAIELIRQFYDVGRSFRITGKAGENKYVQLSNERIAGRPIPSAYPMQSRKPDYQPAVRVPVFDIVVRPQKRSAYSKLAQNELAKELYGLGLFNPQLAEQSVTCLEMMDFDGKDKVLAKVQQGQTLLMQVTQMQQRMQQMDAMLRQLTGGAVQAGVPAVQGMQRAGGGAKRSGQTQASAQKEAQETTMTDYGRRLAQNATPSVQT